MALIMYMLNFLSLKKIIVKLKQNKNICINVFPYADDMAYFVHVSDKAFKIPWIYY